MQSPLGSFETLQQLHAALATYSPLTDDVSVDESLLSRNLAPITSAAAFGAILGVNPKLLTAMARDPRRYYRKFRIKRKARGTRQICAPRTFLKTVQYYVLQNILRPLELPSHVTGFVKGRGIVANGSMHRGALHLLNVDIQDFFGSVGEKQVREFFQGLGYSADMARLLMHLCTYDGSLPQGAPTSPSLANHVFADADQEILALCSSGGISYSRYADDLTFSGPNALPKEFLRTLSKILKSHGFKLNKKKTRLARPGQAKYVTGLVVNERVQAPRDLRRKLRAMFHRAEMDPTTCKGSVLHLLGWASFVNSYDTKLGAKYLGVAKLLESSGPE